MTKTFKVNMKDGTWVVAEVDMRVAVTTESWLHATMHDGSRYIYLNGTAYEKTNVTSVEEII